MRAAAPPAAAARCSVGAARRTYAATHAAALPPPARAGCHATAAAARCSSARTTAAAAAAFSARAAVPSSLRAAPSSRPLRRRRAARSAPLPLSAALDALRSLAGAWDALQKLILTATAAGFLIAAATATTARGRARLRAGWAEFQTSPEGAQAASLVHYLLLLLVAKMLELLTGMRGLLTFVYMGIFATQALHWARTGLPGPEEARARVEALEAGLPYVPMPPPEAHASFRAAFPELASADEALVHAARVALSRGAGAAASTCTGVAYMTASRLCFLEDSMPAEAPAEASAPVRAPRCSMVLPLAACAAVEAEAPHADAPLGGVQLRLRSEGGGAAAADDESGEIVRMSVLPPALGGAPPPRKPVSLFETVAGYWAKATGQGAGEGAAGAAGAA
jgi:hypothetical protein